MEQLGTEQNDINTARINLGGCGTQTAALGFGGDAGGVCKYFRRNTMAHLGQKEII